jgi:hypothetical protein
MSIKSGTPRGGSQYGLAGFAGIVAVAGFLIASMLAGCSRYREDEWSRQWPPRFPTGGLVTLDGAPVAEAVVTFSITRTDRDNKSFTAVGMTDQQGRFALRTFRPGDGAVEGKHAVTISKSSLDKGSLAHAIPSRYARFETSGLEADVTVKTPNEFRFDLSAK